MEGLDAVAVVDVEIDIHDAMPGIPGARDRQGDVVVDAEAGCASGHRVVQPAGRVEGVLDLA